ncbi:MAG: hypothetical protein ACKO23_13030 [Gemmataceae bacterium]
MASIRITQSCQELSIAVDVWYLWLQCSDCSGKVPLLDHLLAPVEGNLDRKLVLPSLLWIIAPCNGPDKPKEETGNGQEKHSLMNR